jgi:hypothetical protein
MSVRFKDKLFHHTSQLADKLYDPRFMMDILHTYSQKPGNKFGVVQRHAYEVSNPKAAIDHDVRYPHPDALRFDHHKRMLFAMSVRIAHILHGSRVCFQKLLSRMSRPSGLHRLNFPAYVVMFYYISLIDSLTHDYEGVLIIIKYIASCTCEIYGEKFLKLIVEDFRMFLKFRTARGTLSRLRCISTTARSRHTLQKNITK